MYIISGIRNNQKAEMPVGSGETDLQTLPHPLLCETAIGKGKGNHGVLRAQADVAWQAGLHLALFFLTY
jgi:hypothetical protein